MTIFKIKGITIEIDGNTTKLGKTLEGINKQSTNRISYILPYISIYIMS